VHKETYKGMILVLFGDFGGGYLFVLKVIEAT
jgi:hypothetical protein